MQRMVWLEGEEEATIQIYAKNGVARRGGGHNTNICKSINDTVCIIHVVLIIII